MLDEALSPYGTTAGSGRFLWPVLALAAVLGTGGLGITLRHDAGPPQPTSADRDAAVAHCRALIAAARARGTYRREEMTRLIEACRAVL